MRSGLRDAAATALIATALAAAYAPALLAPLVDNDSFTVVYSQTTLGRWDGVADMFSPSYFSRFGIGGWRPLSMLAYSLVYRLGGIDPVPYKLFKFGLHASSSAFVFAIGVLLIGDRRWALAAAAAYFLRLLQPATAGLAFFPDYMAAFFCLAAMFGYLKGTTPILVAGLYACGLLSKENALALPALLLLTGLALPGAGQAGSRRSAAALASMLLVAAFYIGVSKWWVVVENFYGPALWTARASPGRALLEYGAYWREFFGSDAVLLVGALGLAGGRVLGGRWLLFVLGWTALSLWSVLNIWPFFPRFESYLLRTETRFLALPGAAMAWLFGFWGANARRRPALSAAACLLGAWWLIASARDDLLARAGWDERLLAGLRQDAAFAGGAPLYGSPFSEAALSLPLIRRASPGTAAEIERLLRRRLPRRDAEETLAFFGDDSLYREAWKAKLAVQLMNQESLPAFLTTLAAESAYRRGREALAAGDAPRALDAFRAALARDEEHEASCLGIAASLQAEGRASQAAKQVGRCRASGLLHEELAAGEDSRPSVREAARDYARALQDGRLNEALRLFDSLRGVLGPLWRVDLRLSRADALLREEKYAQATRAYERVLAEAPSGWQGRGSVERELARLRRGSRAAFDSAMRAFAGGDADTAIAGFGEALRLSPDFIEAYLSRGALYADRGRWDDALTDYDEGLRQPHAARNPLLLRQLMSARAEAARRTR